MKTEWRTTPDPRTRAAHMADVPRLFPWSDAEADAVREELRQINDRWARRCFSDLVRSMGPIDVG